MRRTPRRTARKARRKTRNPNRSKSKTKTKTRSVSASKHTPIKKCVQLFNKYGLTTNKKLIKWMTKNHTDKASKQSKSLLDDYKVITGCFANRKSILKHVQRSKSKSVPKSKSKKKKVKEIKGGGRMSCCSRPPKERRRPPARARPAGPGIQDMPTDMVAEILRHAEARDISSAAQTCKYT